MTKEEILISSGLFEVDGLGRIWRIAKRHGRGVKPGGGYYSGATISPCEPVRAEHQNPQGYLMLYATIDGQRIITMDHRVVWVIANGPIPEGYTINHKDGVKNNNALTNLELATMSEQRRHALDTLNVKRHKPAGSIHPKTNLTEAQVIEIRRRRAGGEMVKDLAAAFKMKDRAISAICARRTWRHI